MAFRIQFEAFGDKPISRTILRVGERGQNLRPVFLVMSKYFYAMESELFRTHGRSGGKEWPDIKQATKDAKARHGDSKVRANADKILIMWETMMRSLTRPNARFSKRQIRQHEMFLGTSDPKAVHHYYGAPAANLPERRPIVFREVDKVQWIKMTQRYLITGEVPPPTIPVF